ncbi:hypothetical protein [Nocardia sp. NPDC004415]
MALRNGMIDQGRHYMTGALDPLDADIGRLHSGLNQPATAAAGADIATVRVGADGALESVQLTDAARRLDPDTLVATIVRLHAAALAESRAAVIAAVARLENDPRLRARREAYVDTLGQVPPSPQQQQTAGQAQPQPAEHGWNTTPATTRSAPTPEDDDADDEYFQRETWLEYD